MLAEGAVTVSSSLLTKAGAIGYQNVFGRVWHPKLADLGLPAVGVHVLRHSGCSARSRRERYGEELAPYPELAICRGLRDGGATQAVWAESKGKAPINRSMDFVCKTLRLERSVGFSTRSTVAWGDHAMAPACGNSSPGGRTLSHPLL